MEHIDSFRNIAELAITIIGFSALISIFQKRGEEWKYQDKTNLLRFYVMLEQAAFILVLCYLPIILINYFDNPDTFVICSVFAAIVTILFVVLAQTRNKRVCGEYIISSFNYIVLVWAFFYVLIAFGNAFKLLGSGLEANYLTLIYYQIIMCILQFMRLIYSSLKR